MGKDVKHRPVGIKQQRPSSALQNGRDPSLLDGYRDGMERDTLNRRMVHPGMVFQTCLEPIDIDGKQRFLRCECETVQNLFLCDLHVS